MEVMVIERCEHPEAILDSSLLKNLFAHTARDLSGEAIGIASLPACDVGSVARDAEIPLSALCVLLHSRFVPYENKDYLKKIANKFRKMDKDLSDMAFMIFLKDDDMLHPFIATNGKLISIMLNSDTVYPYKEIKWN